MTKGQLLEILRNVPLAADIKVYDYENNEYPDFTINTTEQFDYESQMPIVIIQIKQDAFGYLQEHERRVVNEQSPESHNSENMINGTSDPK